MGGHYDKSINIPLNDLTNKITKIKSYKNRFVVVCAIALEVLKPKISNLIMG